MEPEVDMTTNEILLRVNKHINEIKTKIQTLESEASKNKERQASLFSMALKLHNSGISRKLHSKFSIYKISENDNIIYHLIEKYKKLIIRLCATMRLCLLVAFYYESQRQKYYNNDVKQFSPRSCAICKYKNSSFPKLNADTLMYHIFNYHMFDLDIFEKIDASYDGNNSKSQSSVVSQIRTYIPNNLYDNNPLIEEFKIFLAWPYKISIGISDRTASATLNNIYAQLIKQKKPRSSAAENENPNAMNEEIQFKEYSIEKKTDAEMIDTLICVANQTDTRKQKNVQNQVINIAQPSNESLSNQDDDDIQILKVVCKYIF